MEKLVLTVSLRYPNAVLKDVMPANWSTEEGGKYTILDYAKTDEGIRLGYKGSDAYFVKEEE